jgi:glycosyltransferase involved in cell wall biosynthesis
MSHLDGDGKALPGGERIPTDRPTRLGTHGPEVIPVGLSELYLEEAGAPVCPAPASRKIRILLVITGLAVGGATNVVLELANYFNKHPDFDVHLVTGPVPPGRTDATHLAHELGIHTEVIPSMVNDVNPIANLKATTALWRIMHRGNYDIVHTHSSMAGTVGRLAAFAARVPVILHHVHGWALKAGDSRLTQMVHLNLERLCAKFTTRLIVVSEADIHTGLAHRIATEEKFTLVYNGIRLERFRQPIDQKQMRRRLGLDPDCSLVGMVGRLDEQKNPMDFIRAAAVVVEAYSDVQFVLIGDGPLRPECEDLIDELNLKDKLFLLGYRDDVHRILPILTMTAMSSLWEGLPIAFLEAMSAGKPIVANNVDGASDVVINGETGFLVTPHQPTEMAARILQLLKDPELCQQIGRCAREYSRDFSLKRMTTQIESLYRELDAAARASALR